MVGLAGDGWDMTRDELELLATVRIATPCPVRWKEMTGDEKRRFCATCRLHVYRLAELRTEEAVALLQASRTERVCAQVVYRLDGTVMTKDCASSWRVGCSEAVRRLAPVVSVGSVAGFALVMMAAVALGLLVLVGDNVRALFGASAGGALAGTTPVVRRAASQPPAASAGDRASGY
jgi:hypothetical protein